jgi:hypothetical protein
LPSPRRTAPTAPRHRPHRLFFAVLLALLIATVGVTRVVFSRVPVETIVADRYAAAVTHDPAHAARYGEVDAVYQRLTGSNALHYTIHRVAERAAQATGHPGAAQEQAGRASEHPLPHTAWMQALRDLWQGARHTLGASA